jgi:hypothetical protein
MGVPSNSFPAWITDALEKIRAAEDPLDALANWFNAQRPANKGLILSFTGWSHSVMYVSHTMGAHNGDNLLLELAKALNVGQPD